MPTTNNWDGDLLNRKVAGDFLYKVVMQRYEAYHSKPGDSALCFALDADWGAGKTFFIERWSKDIEDNQHPVIHFDAWANDLSDDPLIGFLAALRKSLQPWLSKRPIAPKAKEEIQRQLTSLLKRAGKAALPAMGLLASGAAKRYLGANMEELKEIFSDNTEDASIEESGSDYSEDFSKATEKFFEIALQSHTDRQQAIADLRQSMGALVSYLQEQQIIAAPMVIFIDELDRCRPDYALRLLEGIKHLFNSYGVCFVVSTNLSQLSSAVKAVYGSEFNAYRYLKKFFSFEYHLPTPDNLSYSVSLFQDSLFEEAVKLKQFIPISGLPKKTKEIAADECFALIADSLSLNLRSQRQIFEQIQASLVGWANGDKMVLVYTFFLTAILHKDPKSFDSLFTSSGLSNGTDVSRLLDHDPSIKYSRPSAEPRGWVDAEINLSAVITAFHKMAAMTTEAASQDINSTARVSYPRDHLPGLFGEHFVHLNVSYLPLAKTGRLVRSSGQLR
jgi:hypothetical protein